MTEKAETLIREATAKDLSTILRHRRGMLTDMGFGVPADLDAMEVTSGPFIKDCLENHSFLGWLMEKNGEVIAGGGLMIVGYPSGPHTPANRKAFILNVYTEPGQRRHGYAKAIVETIIAWCKEAGFPSVFLHASDAGRHIYETLGFKPTNEMRLVLK
jgi:GNAT superfamily N-acetyltransferase